MKCALLNCNSSSENKNELGISFHLFPKNAALYKIWIATFETHGISIVEAARKHVCSLHFKKDQIYRIPNNKQYLRLLRNAVPTEFNFPHDGGMQSINQNQAITKAFMKTDSSDKEQSITIEKHKVYTLYKTCRTCLKTNQNASQMTNIFEYSSQMDIKKIHIMDELLLMKLEVKCDDGLPQQICNDCKNELKCINLFRIQCEQSQEILKEYFFNLPTSLSSSLLHVPAVSKLTTIENSKNYQPLNVNDVEFVKVDNDNEFQDKTLMQPVVNIKVESSDNYQLKKEVNNYNKYIHKINYNNIDTIKFDMTDIKTMHCYNEYADVDSDDSNSAYENFITDNALFMSKNIPDNCDFTEKKVKYVEYGKNDKNIENDKSDEIVEHKENDNSDEKRPTNNILNTMPTKGAFNCCFVNKETKCRICKKWFPNYADLQNHIKETHSKDVQLLCSMCKKSFRNQYFLNAHIRNHCKNKPQCNMCKKKFPTKDRLQNHMFRLHTPHKCPHCKLKFQNMYTMHKHLKTHNKQFKCDICEYLFSHQHELSNHKKNHADERTFLCNICGKGCNTYYSLTNHLNYHKKLRYTCDICNKDFTQLGNLKIHMRLHSGVRPYLCDICSKGFHTSYLLKTHMSKHGATTTRTTTTTSTTINSSYTNTSNIEIYAYPCVLCNKRFKIPSSLTFHMRVHTNERKFKCSICDMAFKSSTHLKTHTDGVHLKKRPFKCDECGKTFRNSGDKLTHTRIHTGEKPYKCEICDVDFRIYLTLSTHIAKFHRNGRPE